VSKVSDAGAMAVLLELRVSGGVFFSHTVNTSAQKGCRDFCPFSRIIPLYSSTKHVVTKIHFRFER
jgi:hypothetical protein